MRNFTALPPTRLVARNATARPPTRRGGAALITSAPNLAVQTVAAEFSARQHRCVLGEVVFISEKPLSRSPAGALRVQRRPRCAFSLSPTEVVAGVWHCRACERQLASVERSWGQRVTTRYLASTPAATPGARSALLPEASVVNTGEAADNYLSTLGKGLLGLKRMYEELPTHKWFGVFGDDVFVHADNLADALSAFDPDEEWCFSQAGPHPRHGFRAFGGAGIITSRALTRRLAPLLEPWLRSTESAGSKNGRLHDVAFGRLLAAAKAPLAHLDGLFSQPPGFYLSAQGSADVPRGLPVLAASFHYIRAGYMEHLDRLCHGVCFACRPPPPPPSLHPSRFLAVVLSARGSNSAALRMAIQVKMPPPLTPLR